MCRVVTRLFRFALILLLVPIPLLAQRTRVVEKPSPAVQGNSDAIKLAPLDIWVNENGDTMTGTLTLNPTGDQALDVSTGSIYKGGALFIHTKGGANNTALGLGALSSVTTGYFNTASGQGALYSNTTGYSNTAAGKHALYSNTTGFRNVAVGDNALSSNTTGNDNTASGYWALYANTTGNYNTATGDWALYNNTAGKYNNAVGSRALYYNTTGYRNTAMGANALFSNTTAYDNTASGFRALYANTDGSSNTASGSKALYSNTTGFRNTASGYLALFSSTTGFGNTADGVIALFFNTTGSRNTACGYRALLSNTTGSDNTAGGYRALVNNTTGLRNIAVGFLAGSNLTTGSDNIAIGNDAVAGESATTRVGSAQTRAFIAGIRGVTTGLAAIPVMIDSAGQLGTVSSSRRFKEDIVDMGDATDRLLDLRAVLFRYKERNANGDGPIEFGLIAEEVAEVFPELVVYDSKGRPETVKYHLLSTMLLNELQKEHKRVEQLQARDAEQDARLAALEQRE